jgi:hypothetical protein
VVCVGNQFEVVLDDNDRRALGQEPVEHSD